MFWELSRDRLAWWTVAIVLGMVVLGVLVVFIGTFVTALFLYYVSRPVYRRLLPKLGRTLAAAGALLSLAIPIVILVAYTLLIGLQELQQLAEEVDLGPIQGAIEPYFDLSGIVQDPASLLENPDFVDTVTVVIEGALQYLPVVVVGFLHLFVALATTFYLLRDGPRLAQWVRTTFDNDAQLLTRYGRIVDQDLSSVFFGNILNAAITAVIAAITYNVLNVFAPPELAIPYPVLLGLLAGAASLIPAVGMKLVYVPVAVLLFVQAFLGGDPLWFPSVFFIISLVIVDTIPDLVLRPYVSGKNLHIGLVMITYILGPLLFGWYGLFLGPLLLVLVVHFARVALPELLEGAPRPATPVDEAIPGDEATPIDESATTVDGVSDPPGPAGPPGADGGTRIDSPSGSE